MRQQLNIHLKTLYNMENLQKDFVIKDDRAYIQLQNDKLVELTFKKQNL